LKREWDVKENKGRLCMIEHNANIVDAAVGKKAHLWMMWHSSVKKLNLYMYS